MLYTNFDGITRAELRNICTYICIYIFESVVILC